MRTTAWIIVLAAFAYPFRSVDTAPKPGFVIHFDFISNAREARDLVRIAAHAGARVINVVPPAHIWENRGATEMLDQILEEISHRNLSVVITRIDAAFPPDAKGGRFNYLYGRILTEPGVGPSGKKTSKYFLTTVGRAGYAEWMEDETHYYAEHYGRMPNLLGIDLGPFSEPFAAERCGFLEYESETGRYEITQYTPEARNWFHHWLSRRYHGLERVNAEYGTAFASMDEIPLPVSETDGRFARAALAYYDFAGSLNDWLMEAYQRCRHLWHEASGRADVPFILQLSGFFPEKLIQGHPSFAAFDIPEWIYGADALGVSLYTNSGFPDFGHASILAAVNIWGLARDLHKEVFVLEGGTEAPNVILDPGELEFYGTVARKLNPRTYIYEFLKDKFDDPFQSNPGKLVDSAGRIRKPAYRALQKLFREISTDRTSPASAELYFLSDAAAARGDAQRGNLNAALYDIASEVSIRYVPRKATMFLRPGVPIVTSHGDVSPKNEELSQLFRHIPDINAPARKSWHCAVVEAIRKIGAEGHAFF